MSFEGPRKQTPSPEQEPDMNKSVSPTDIDPVLTGLRQEVERRGLTDEVRPDDGFGDLVREMREKGIGE